MYNFTGDINGGVWPDSVFLTNSGSTFYGTTNGGGTSGNGTIFQIDANGTGFQVLHSFTGTDRLWPESFVIKSSSKLYGMATYGGIASGSGSIFEFSLPFSNCTEVIADSYRLAADLNSDCYVNFKDLDIFADYWLNTNCGSTNNCSNADFVPADGTVNFSDFSDFAEQWTRCNNPQDANCTHTW